MKNLKIYIQTLNLFQSGDTEETPYQHRSNLLATRIYLILLSILLVLIGFFTAWTQKTEIVAIQDITQIQFESIADLVCPCSRKTLSYGDFVNISTVMHPICSSDFISQQWIESLYFGRQQMSFFSMDIRFASYIQFQALLHFCQLSTTIVRQNLLKLESTPFINFYLLSKFDLQSEVQGTFVHFQLTKPQVFKIQIDLIDSMLRNNLLISGTGTETYFVFNTQLEDNRIRISTPFYLDQNQILCLCSNNPQCLGVSGIFYDMNDPNFSYFPFIFIPGFVSGCSRVYSTLVSSLECFFNQTCIDSIGPYLNSSHNFSAMRLQQSSQFNISNLVQELLAQLMTESWLINISYDKYLSQCAPEMCTYLKRDFQNFKSVLTVLIGVLGGLCTFLGIIVPIVVHRLRRAPTTEIVIRAQLSMMNRLLQLRDSMIRSIVELNLFQIQTNDLQQLTRQRLITRFYIVLLLIVLVTFSLYNVLRMNIHQEIILNPTEFQFIELQTKYSTSLSCPCSKVSISYEQFLNITPIYHQICTSDLVSPEWFIWLYLNAVQDSFHLSFRSVGRFYFRILNSLCKLSQRTITNALAVFLREQLVTNQVLSKESFNSQASTFISTWRRATTYNLLQAFYMMHAFRQGNQLMGTQTSFNGTIGNTGEVFISSSNQFGENCSCLLSNTCRSPIGVYNDDKFLAIGEVTLLFNIPGLYTGCVASEALLSSTLECFYNSDCLQALNVSLQQNPTFPTMGNFRSLNPIESQSNETVASMLNQLFVNRWIEDISFSHYYQACATRSCTFTYLSRRDFISVLLIIVGVFGGLNTALKILLFIFLRLWNKIRLTRPLPGQLRLVKDWFFDWHREEYFRGRIRIVLLIIGLISFSISYGTTQVYNIQETSKPSLNTYVDLYERFTHVLRCPCSKASIVYHSFLNHTVLRRHEICSSDFVTDRWIRSLVLLRDQSDFSPYDYRTIAVGHFQFLSFLCQLTQQHIDQALLDLQMTMFISSQVISINDFNEYFRAILEQFHQTLSDTFSITLQMTNDIIVSGGYMSLFQTNWKLNSPVDFSSDRYWTKIPMEPVIYGNCNCASSLHCIQPATVSNQSIVGFMVGCYPSESLLKSSLECLYDITCFSRIKTMADDIHPLNRTNPSQYPMNSSVSILVNKLMVDDWETHLSYEQYYTECAPLSCSYTHLSRLTSLEILSNLLGLYGGLMIITQILVVSLIGLWKNVVNRQHRQTRVANKQ